MNARNEHIIMLARQVNGAGLVILFSSLTIFACEGVQNLAFPISGAIIALCLHLLAHYILGHLE